MNDAVPARPEVFVIALGGTASATRSLEGGVVPTMSAGGLLGALPDLSDVAVIRVVDSGTPPLPGPHLTLEMIVELAATIQQLGGGQQGATVVSQGTDTIEETAFALDLLLPADRNVVVTGAMRDPTLPGADGSANLLGAIRVAADPRIRGLGALVVLGDQIHAARYVRKLDSTLPAAFASTLTGPVGTIVEDRVIIRSHPVRYNLPALLPLIQRLPDVALLTASMGDDGRLIDSVADCGYDGLVYEAFGGGHSNPQVADRLEALAAKIPVVVTSRTGSGALLRHTYGFVGSERDLIQRGLSPVDDINGPKARILLSLLIGAGLTPGTIASTITTLSETGPGHEW